MTKRKRSHSIVDYSDYPKYKNVDSDALPRWFTTPLTLMDAAKKCRYCGNHVPAMREHFCSKNCEKYFRHAAHDTKINSVRRFVHRYFNFECRECGRRMSYEVPSGLELPIYAGEVDHVVPLKDGGENLISNLQLLCVSCHMKKTIRQR